MEDNVSFRLLEQRVGHIESGVGEIKIDMRRLEAKIESTRDTVSEVKDSVADLRVETKDGFAALRAEMTDGSAALRAEMTDGFAALRAEMTDRFAALRTETTDGFAVLRAEMTDRFAALRAEMTDGFAASNQRHTELAATITVLVARVDHLDQKTDVLDRKVDDGFSAIHCKLDSFGEELMVRVNALFDRKFFRAMSVFVGVVPPTVMLTSMAEKASLGTYSMLAIAVGIPVVLITGTFLATRTSR